MKVSDGNFSVELVKHTVNPLGDEAITFLHTHERQIHSEYMTHRWSRNSSSSRAIPLARMISWTTADPVLPLLYGKNQGGMQCGEEIEEKEQARKIILAGLDYMVNMVRRLDDLGLHKEIVNRYLEPWAWITSVGTMSKAYLLNAFKQRVWTDGNKMSNPSAARLFGTLLELTRVSEPTPLRWGEWHIPFDDRVLSGPAPLSIDSHAANPELWSAIIWSVARCAWTSYNNPTKDATFEKALSRWQGCLVNHHMTPTEHQLMAAMGGTGIVKGYASYRSMIPGECAEFDMDQEFIIPGRDGVERRIKGRGAHGKGKSENTG